MSDMINSLQRLERQAERYGTLGRFQEIEWVEFKGRNSFRYEGWRRSIEIPVSASKCLKRQYFARGETKEAVMKKLLEFALRVEIEEAELHRKLTGE